MAENAGKFLLPIRIALRTDITSIPYRHFATAALSARCPNPTITVCSGKWDTRILTDIGPTGVDLRDEIVRAANPNGHVIIVGTSESYFTKIGDTSGQYSMFDSFAKKLTATSAETHTISRTEKARYWHAKIILVESNNVPIAAVIGSSNMSLAASAYGATYWNHESDVVVWSHAHPNRHDFENALGLPDNSTAITFETMLDGTTSQPNEVEQLQRLKKLLSDVEL